MLPTRERGNDLPPSEQCPDGPREHRRHRRSTDPTKGRRVGMGRAEEEGRQENRGRHKHQQRHPKPGTDGMKEPLKTSEARLAQQRGGEPRPK